MPQPAGRLSPITSPLLNHILLKKSVNSSLESLLPSPVTLFLAPTGKSPENLPDAFKLTVSSGLVAQLRALDSAITTASPAMAIELGGDCVACFTAPSGGKPSGEKLALEYRGIHHTMRVESGPSGAKSAAVSLLELEGMLNGMARGNVVKAGDGVFMLSNGSLAPLQAVVAAQMVPQAAYAAA